ncbi:RNA polymerase II transcription factor B subunit 4 [Spathaspora sp. JA1]|nr:RNA polymerase II transcription factor B subunit 4 [Spathaspora sp. JA1]
MEAISERVFTEPTSTAETISDEPSLLTIILDVSPLGWYKLRDLMTVEEMTKNLLVFLNAHLALNNSNQVAFIASSSRGSRFLYPNPSKSYQEVKVSDGGNTSARDFVSKGMYRQFRIVDKAVLEELNEFIKEKPDENIDSASKLSGALSMALTYTNRMLTLDQSITTTTASAIASTTNASTAGTSSSSSTTTGSSTSGSGTGSTSTSTTSMTSRILVVSANDDSDVKYIPIMNTIFAAQKMKVSIDIIKLGNQENSSYLQQPSDATNGIYLHLTDPRGIIQVLSTAYFIEPSLRPYIILPTNSNVNYRASCFITGKAVDLGYVCSVCLCIMSIIPESKTCPTCQSQFDEKIIHQLTKEPEVVKKKRKLDSSK